MTAQDLTALADKLDELGGDASPAPWVAPETSDGDVWDTRANGEPGIPLVRAERGNYRSWGRALSNEERTLNAIFIAELRNALPQITTALREAAMMREALEALCDALDEFHDHGTYIVSGRLAQAYAQSRAALSEEPGHGA